jgi:hypothetical protein
MPQGMDPKHLYHFPRCGSSIDILVDLRRMINKRPVTFSPLSTMVHPDSGWGKGHAMHLFYQKKCMLSVVIPVCAPGPVSVADFAKRALEEVQIVKCTDVEFDQDEAPPPEPAPRPKAKKAKTQATE